jgi:hypothetical protein
MVQLAPAARLVPHEFANPNEDAFVPVTAMLVIESAAVPELVMVTVCELLVEPTFTEPNARLVADRVTDGSPPVPLKAMVCGELMASSVMVMAAVSAPVVVGAKCPWMVQFAPPAKLVPQLFPKTNEDALAPVNAMLVMDTAAVPVLVMVMDCDALVVPTFTEPNERLAADSVTGPGNPVPLRAMFCGEPGPM